MEVQEVQTKKKKKISNKERVKLYKKRILLWYNPVEYVNNMYGSHPDEREGVEYFQEIFKNESE